MHSFWPPIDENVCIVVALLAQGGMLLLCLPHCRVLMIVYFLCILCGRMSVPAK